MVKRARVADTVEFRSSSLGHDPIVPWKRQSVVDSGRSFPDTSVVSIEEGRLIRLLLLKALQLGGSASDREVLDKLYAIGRPLVSPQSSALELVQIIGTLMREAGLLSDQILVVLPLEGGFSSAVRMFRSDIIAFFDDVWYPSMDDLLLIDEHENVALLVDHHEKVSVIPLPGWNANRFGE